MNIADEEEHSGNPEPSASGHEITRTISIYGISPPLASVIYDIGMKMALSDPYQSINILFTSGGGSVYEEIAASDALWAIKKQLKGDAYINGVVHGCAYSAAATLLQTCDKRRMSSDALLMIHGMHTSHVQGDQAKIKAEVTEMNLLNRHMLNAYMARSTKSEKQWKKLLDVDGYNYLSAQQSLDWGLVDEIIPSRFDHLKSLQLMEVAA